MTENIENNEFKEQKFTDENSKEYISRVNVCDFDMHYIRYAINTLLDTMENFKKEKGGHINKFTISYQESESFCFITPSSIELKFTHTKNIIKK